MLDQIIVVLYLVTTLTIGLISGRNTRSFKDYAIGRRDLSTLVLVAAVFASIIEASDTMNFVEAVFTNGPIEFLAYLGVIFSHLTLAFFIAPKLGPYLGLLSSGDVLEKLYGRRAKTLMGVSTIVESILLAGAQILALSQISHFFFAIPQEIAALYYFNSNSYLFFSRRDSFGHGN